MTILEDDRLSNVKKVKVKECTKCTHLLPLSDYHDSKSSKDKKDSWCKACRNDYLSKWYEQRLAEDPYKYLLRSSAQNAYYRGQPSYNKPPYQNTRCAWSSPREFLNDLYHDEDWMEAWKEQADIYLETGEENDRPSIGRIDHGLHYSRDNIQVQSLGVNKAEAVSKPCQVWIIKNKNINNDMELVELQSKKALKEELENRGIPYNLIKNIDEGIIHPVGNGIQILIQTTDGELKEQEKPLYILSAHYQKYLIDYETNQEYLIIDNKCNLKTGGIRINKNELGVIGVTPN